MKNQKFSIPGLTENEKEPPIVIYRSHLNEWFNIVLVCGLSLVAGILTQMYEWSLQWIPLGSIAGLNLAFPLPLFAILPLALLGIVVHNLYNYKYILCADYVLSVKGLWDFNRSSVRINYVHIRGVEIDEGLAQRLFGLGDLRILGTAGTGSDHAVIMEGIRNPRKIKDIIQTRMNEKLNLATIAASCA